MATSGTYVFNPRLIEILDEAFERVGIDLLTLVDKHISSARRSINYVYQTWANKGIREWKLTNYPITLQAGVATYTLPVEVLDVYDMVVNRAGFDTMLRPTTKKDYLELPNKTHQGLPDRYLVKRERDQATVTLWPVPQFDGDIITYTAMTRIQDADSFWDNPDVPWLYQDALVAELAARLALKWNQEKHDLLKSLAKEATELATTEGRQRGALTIQVSL
jgi:hypothetical protein